MTAPELAAAMPGGVMRIFRLSPRYLAHARALLAALCCVASGALADVAVPPLTARVTDLTATLAAPERAALESKLEAFEARKGAQIAVLMLPTTEPETIEQFGMRVVEAWKLGRKGIDDGALLLVAKDDRTVRLEVGYGLEGALPDATANRIVDEIIVPRFRDGDFYGGIDAGVERMIAVVDGEPLPEPQAGPQGIGAPDGLESVVNALPLLFIFTVTLGTLLKRGLGQLGGSLVTGGFAGGLAWLLIGGLSAAGFAALIAFALTLLSRAGPGGWASGRSGRGGGFGGGSRGGGGFSGGGGGFGGGGASGRW